VQEKSECVTLWLARKVGVADVCREGMMPNVYKSRQGGP